jgi:hypothetical protein
LNYDGRPFTSSILLLEGIAVGCLPWLSLLGSRTLPSRRRLAVVTISASTLAALLIGLALPGSHQAQKAFEHHSAEP